MRQPVCRSIGWKLELPLDDSPPVRRVRPGVPTLPPRPAADGTRGRILLAGLGLFAQHGFHGTSIRDIAAEAAVQSAETARFRDIYNRIRPHQALDDRTPRQAYLDT